MSKRRAQRRPKPPFVAQHQRKPGHESKLRPQPAFEALSYRPAGKPGAAIRATSPAVLTLLGGETTAG